MAAVAERRGRTALRAAALLAIAWAAPLAGCGNEGPAGPAATGSLTVTVTAEGVDIDTDGLVVSVDGTAAGPVAPGAPLTVSELAGGTYEVALSGLSANCAVAGGASRTVDVTSDSEARVAFTLNCRAVLRDAIVFMSNRDGNWEVYSMRSDGRDPTRLTHEPGLDIDPAVSPDGTRIAFSSNRTGDYEIWTMDADGSDPVQLTTATGGDLYPTWSSDGERIAFWSTRNGGGDIFVMDADGAGTRNVSSPGTAFLPSWSPDGRTILHDRGGGLWTMGPDGSGARLLVARSDSLRLAGPAALSPDGTTIAFTYYDRSTVDWQVHLVDSDGGNLRALAKPFVASVQYPAWSPSSDELLFTSDNTGDWELYRMRLDGTGLTNLTASPGEDRCSPQAWVR